MLLLCLILLVFSDNIEIRTKDFDEIRMDNLSLYSKYIKDANSVKISSLANSLYRLHQVSPRIFQVVDRAVYLQSMTPSPLRVDLEYKVYGLQTFVWRFIMFNIVVAIGSVGVISYVFSRFGPVVVSKGKACK